MIFVDREEAVLQLAQDVFMAAKALLFAAGQVVAAVVAAAAAAAAARKRRRVAQPLLRFLFPGWGGTGVSDTD